MQKLWFTSDLHCGHSNIIKYCDRPFMQQWERDAINNMGHDHYKKRSFRLIKEDVDEMDATMIDNINEVVKPNDILYVLGDFCWGDETQVRHYRDLIQCQHVHLILGNHDMLTIYQYKSMFETIDKIKEIKWEEQKMVLSHYPIIDFNGCRKGAILYHAHKHGRLQGQLAAGPLTDTELAEKKALAAYKVLDVGVDTHNFYPWSFEETLEYFKYKH